MARKLKVKGQAGLVKLYTKYRCAANRRNYKFSLSLQQFKNITKKNCFYCGVKPLHKCISTSKRTTEATKRYGTYLYNGVDRLDNTKGYTINNSVPCCGNCNRAKHFLTKEQFLCMIKKIYEHLEL